MLDILSIIDVIESGTNVTAWLISSVGKYYAELEGTSCS